MKISRFPLVFAIDCAVAATIAPLLVLVAIAPSFASFSQVHRSTSGGKDKVIIPNQTPDSTIALTVGSTAVRSVTFDDCGVGKLTDSTSSPIVGISTGGSLTFNFAGRTTATAAPNLAVCGGASTGSVVKFGNTYYLYSGNPTLGAINLSVSSGRSFNTKVNSCGFASVSITASRPLTNFQIGSTSYALASLPVTTSGGLVCRKTSGVAIGAAVSAIAYRPMGGF